MSLLEIIKANADKFSDIPAAEDLAGKLSKALEGLGYNILANPAKDPQYLPKSRFDELTATKNELKKQVGDLSGQLEELKKAATGNEELTKKIEELQAANEQATQKVKQTSIEAAAKVAAIQAKAKDPGDIMRFLDLTKVTVSDDGAVVGLEEQLKALAEGKAYLFDTGAPSVGGGSNPPGGSGNPTPTFTRDQLKTMTADQINANWSAISEQMAAGKL